MRLRSVVVHYHLFKNAGTSVDDALKEAFGGSWANVEADKGLLAPDQLADFIRGRPDVGAFSSHTAMFPVPAIEACEIFPIVFLRHPIDRIHSVYEFERKQGAETEGAAAARTMSFADYVAWRLDRPGDYQCRNFHVARLSAVRPRKATLETALALLDQLPFVGLVEHFDKSIALLNRALGGTFPGVVLRPRHANRSRAGSTSVGERLERIRLDLSPALFTRLRDVNRPDLTLFGLMRERFRQAASRRHGASATGFKDRPGPVSTRDLGSP